MASASSGSTVGLIGICGRKFTRNLALAGLLALLVAASGCGGDDEEASTTPAATTPAETAATESVPTETEEQPAETETSDDTAGEDEPAEDREGESPEAQPGGAGDEVAARTLALFTGRAGRITPRVIRVPAFISVRVELRSADGATYSLRFGKATVAAGEKLNSHATTIDGLRPGESITGKPGGAGNPVRIEATAEPGP
jgi:hypothetical protein